MRSAYQDSSSQNKYIKKRVSLGDEEEDEDDKYSIISSDHNFEGEFDDSHDNLGGVDVPLTAVIDDVPLSVLSLWKVDKAFKNYENLWHILRDNKWTWDNKVSRVTIYFVYIVKYIT